VRDPQVIVLVVVAVGCGGPATTPDATPGDGADPRRLSSTGLDADGVRAFAPRYQLWSDGAVKQRWLWLPPGTTIDTSDPAHWQLPVGAKLWKQFAAPDGRKLETRLIERIAAAGVDDADYRAGAFVWLDDESDAILAEDGAIDVRGTGHDVPSATLCRTCHTGEPGFVLGVSTVQLSGGGLAALADVLSARPPDYDVPGDAVTVAALGYLHANCGHCHNPGGSARPDVDMTLQLDLTATAAAETTIWRATVGVPLFRFAHPCCQTRVAPGDPDASAVAHRMSRRDDDAMPPIATEEVDAAGVAAVRAWIEQLPP
jgi:hypothetical protein